MNGEMKEMNLLENAFNEQDKDIGMRLVKLQVLNWGAYNEEIYSFEPNRANCLIEGNSGSGKTTLLDAMLTLLIQHKRINYNKASDASASSDRTLRAYILGSRAPGENNQWHNLRDKSCISTLLAVFSDSYARVFTIAQVMYIKPDDSVDTTYITANKELTIENDLTDYTSVPALRKRLRNTEGVKLPSTYAEYQEELFDKLGIENREALELWMRATSMKNVQSVDKFVKTGMLEEKSLYDEHKNFVSNLKRIQDSKKALDLVVKKYTLLKTIVNAGDKYEEIHKSIDRQNYLKSLIKPWATWKTGQMAQKEYEACQNSLNTLDTKINDFTKKMNEEEKVIIDLNAQLKSNGGFRQKDVQDEILRLDTLLNKKVTTRNKLNQLLKQIGLESIQNGDDFYNMRKVLPSVENTIKEKRQILKNKTNEIAVAMAEVTHDKNELVKLIHQLEQNPDNNLPQDLVQMRKQMCRELSLPESDLPFAGELMQVKKSAKEEGWESAIEKLVYPFSTTMLVNNSLYEKVSNWVNAHDILFYNSRTGKYDRRGKIKYDKISSNVYESVETKEDEKVHAYDMISLKEEHEYANWIRNHLMERFNEVCCETMEEFRREKFAVTKKGQMKKKGYHHEKSDTRKGDRSYFVMGYSNKERLKGCREKLQKLQVKENDILKSKEEVSNAESLNENKSRDLYLIGNTYTSFDMLDIETVSKKLQQAKDELAELEKKNPENKVLQDKIDKAYTERNNINTLLNKATERRGVVKGNMEAHQKRMMDGKQAEELLDKEQYDKETLGDTLMAGSLGAKKVELNDKEYYVYYDKIANAIEKTIDSRLQDQNKKLGEWESKYESAALEYVNNTSPLFNPDQENSTLTATINSLNDFRVLMEETSHKTTTAIARDRQGQTLDIIFGNAKSSITSLNASIKKQITAYKEKIDTLNETVKTIEWGKGRHISLCYRKTGDNQIIRYRKCLDEYNEYLTKINIDEVCKNPDLKREFDFRLECFLREYDPQLDKNIAVKVKHLTDVRNHLEYFCQVTNDKNDEVEVYNDSSSKSGGEKESLAYTIIAASLYYNFNLTTKNDKAQSFRLIFIDEAFSNCSADYKKQCLDLFAKFHLQVIIITPSSETDAYLDYVKGGAIVTMNDETHTSSLVMQRYILEDVKESS